MPSINRMYKIADQAGIKLFIANPVGQGDNVYIAKGRGRPVKPIDQLSKLQPMSERDFNRVLMEAIG